VRLAGICRPSISPSRLGIRESCMSRLLSLTWLTMIRGSTPALTRWRMSIASVSGNDCIISSSSSDACALCFVCYQFSHVEIIVPIPYLTILCLAILTGRSARDANATFRTLAITLRKSELTTNMVGRRYAILLSSCAPDTRRTRLGSSIVSAAARLVVCASAVVQGAE
jgi:hypothetical protein